MRRLLLLVVVAALLAGGYFCAALYLPYGKFPKGGVFVDIPHGVPSRTIARLLANKGVIRSRFAFDALTRWRKGRILQAGEYHFDHPATAFEVFETLAEGKIYVKEIVVPEGFTMFDIADLAAQEGFVSREEFLAAARDPSPIRDLAPNAPTLEGFLFPATYEFPRHPTGQEMVAAMVRRFRQVWESLPAGQADAEHRSVQDVVTLASLVERETPRAEERAHIAGVFENRLRLGLPLQCDPTVVYALKLANQFEGKLESSELRFPSPYNTYRNRGLPPGPIANPGEAALRAALNPATTKDLYFVANTEGGHFFSATLAQHDKNVARYRRLLRQIQDPEANRMKLAPAARKPAGQGAR
jgi:peptidoglycan lytic transglycosylase G